MALEQTCPNPLLRSDAAALIGLLAVLEGAIWTGSLPADVVAKVQVRLVREGLLGVDGRSRGVRQAVANLNQRLRYVLGEYDQPPQSISVPE